MSTTIRVSETTRDRLAALARQMGRPMTEVVVDALDALEKRVRLEEFNASYAELREDPARWAEVVAERTVEERSLKDNLG